ncbi:hypothetical protein B9479_007215 [Cryptococcus floricola]|uniref:Uncharacterized protein n=1 Tax=Cryptococcus floricola TaxID=2591691 RepID=A0A5D3AQ75_9TREE|nr:hypothetical protein B9479_007215 [Cryptococcus floricola]
MSAEAEPITVTRVSLSEENASFALQAIEALGDEILHSTFWAGKPHTAAGNPDDQTYWSYSFPNAISDAIAGERELSERANAVEKYMTHTSTTGEPRVSHSRLFRPVRATTLAATCREYIKETGQPIGPAWPVAVSYTLEAQAQLCSELNDEEKTMLTTQLRDGWSGFGLAGNTSQSEEGRPAEDNYPPFFRMIRRESEGILNDQVSVSVPDTPQPWSYETEFMLNDHSKGSIVNRYAMADADISTA